MNRKQTNLVGLSSLLLVACSAFAACGGLDARKVTRDDGSSAGMPGAGGSDPGVGGGSSSTGGGDTSPGGASPNPFGGNTFEGGAPPVVDGPPEVIEVDPENESEEAEPSGNVSVLFSEGLDPSTVTAESLRVTDDSGALVAGEVSYEGVIGSFSPDRRLSLLASYDVTVTRDVTDAGGNPLQEEFTSTFTVRDGIWGAQGEVFTDHENFVSKQDLASDGRGNTLVVWLRRVTNETTQTYSLVGRWYRPTTGWLPEFTLDTTDTDRLDDPVVAVSPDGDAVVAWTWADAIGSQRVRARRYVNGRWETEAITISDPTFVFNQHSYVTVAIGADQIVAAWIRREYTGAATYTIHHNLTLAATTLDGEWSAPTQNYGTTYTFANPNDLGEASATVDAAGNATVVFRANLVSTDPNYGRGVYYSRRAPNGEWLPPAKIPGAIKQPAGAALVQSDSAGAMAIWTEYDSMTPGNPYALMASRYTKAKGFVAPVPIHDPDLTADIGMTRRGFVGNATGYFVAYSQTVGTTRNVYATRYDLRAGAWDELPTVVSDGVSYGGYLPSVGVDDHGNAILAHDPVLPSDLYGVMASRYSAVLDEWTPFPMLLSSARGSYEQPLVAVGGNGVGTVLFRETGGEGPGVPMFPAGGQYAIFK